jgi:hypothetical protein
LSQNSIVNKLSIGDELRIYHGKKNPNNKTLEVRGFVDGRVIVRNTSTDEYQLLTAEFIQVFKDGGALTII